MKNWKHINFEQRKMIVSCITHNKKLCEIAAILNVDPTSISKEVKRNRTLSKYGNTSKQCPLLNRWPYVCTNCYKKYTTCHLDQYRYDSKVAQNNADANLINSRTSIFHAFFCRIIYLITLCIYLPFAIFLTIFSFN